MVHLLASEVRQLLHNKFVVILGDSVQRAVYKDLVLLLQKDCLLTPRQLKAKGEVSFEQDELMEGSPLHNGTSYREVRQFRSGHHLVRFYFLTRVYSEYLESILQQLQSGEDAPDLVIMNSCLWDLSRYGRDSWSSYRKNLESLFGRLGQVLPESCLLVWNTATPVGDKITASFLPCKRQPWVPFLKFAVVEANFYSSAEAKKHHFDVLDLHFHLRHATCHRHTDGVHWNGYAHRHISQLLLAHVADAWGVELPHRLTVSKWIQNGPAAEPPGQEVERQPWGDRDQLASPLSPPMPPPRRGPLLPFPRLPPPPLALPPSPPVPPPRCGPLFPPPPPHPIPLHQVMPQFPLCSQDACFSSDHIYQSDQFFFHSDIPSGLSSEADFMFGPQRPVPCLSTSWYQQRAPVVHRGFPRSRPHGPYVPWGRRGRPSKRRPPTLPESRP
ncbi:PREDICTED: PC-esterase domain-containing protein 1B [Galeopterus variegatus]|uniref:PC-esterase domain-containing protein 1B n=1 Tax=Galeopterus variegatus TaxID=482537 RepID=A0ABM0RZ31_GALVR|nr:PREDICTED: PC-esterase domain-containing protein 1B [Galeopterus variegatus]